MITVPRFEVDWIKTEKEIAHGGHDVNLLLINIYRKLSNSNFYHCRLLSLSSTK